MCGIVAYFGGAGNNLTRVLTGMSAIIYRAPDSTGVALFGNENEPITTRKAVGSVEKLVEELIDNSAYRNDANSLLSVLSDGDMSAHQQRLITFEGFPPPSPTEGETVWPCYDNLVELNTDQPVRLSPGQAGRPFFDNLIGIRSRKLLKKAIMRLIGEYDLSPAVIREIIRKPLLKVIFAKQELGQIKSETVNIMNAFERIFETALSENQPPKGLNLAPVPLRRKQVPSDPQALKSLCRCLAETRVQIPSDYDRDAVCCMFRLLDASLMTRLAFKPDLIEDLEKIMEYSWPLYERPHPVNWKTLYEAEKSVNVYGRAAAAALMCLQREGFLTEMLNSLSKDELMTEASIVPGQTDSSSLRYFTQPLIAHGRWALQSAVTVKNAHPFTDEKRYRCVVVNGQFDSQTEESIEEFLTKVARLSFRSENSAEYLALLWGYYFQQFNQAQQRYEAVLAQVENHLEKYGVGSSNIDFAVYHTVKNKTSAELDEMAFIKACDLISQNGGQIAACGMSIISPRRLYVAAHNRPVFIVRRMENDDFMIVSDINAAMGLFPQQLIFDKRNETERLIKEYDSKTAAFRKEKEKILRVFAVEVHALDGEELFARIETGINDGQVARSVTITDFDGRPLPETEPFNTVLNPAQVKKDMERSFYETHLHEIPLRLTDQLNSYAPDENELPDFDIRKKVLRRRFGKDLKNLRRIVLAGTGSAFFISAIVKKFIHDVMPEIDVLLVRPSEIENPDTLFISSSDLVILVSWSSVTADMVLLARKLLNLRVVVTCITEKTYADMALIVSQSVGVIPCLSGEEVTISGVKSTVCMLFSLTLFCSWVASCIGRPEEARSHVEKMHRLPFILDNFLKDEMAKTFSKRVALESAASSAIIVISALDTNGTGYEAALKLEESTWSAIGKALDYQHALRTGMPATHAKISILADATSSNRLDEAIEVMQLLYDKNISFTAVGMTGHEETRIRQLSAGNCIFLPGLKMESLQQIITLVFYYQLAFYCGQARGIAKGVAPRNRAKSVTVGRSLFKRKDSPAKELLKIKMQAERMLAPSLPSPLKEDESFWEKEAHTKRSRQYYEEIRRLAGIISADGLPQLLNKASDENIQRLADALFDINSDIEEIVFAPMDRRSEAAVKSAAGTWSRLLNYPVRIITPQEPLVAFGENTLLFAVAFSPAGRLDEEIRRLTKRLESAYCPVFRMQPSAVHYDRRMMPDSGGAFLLQDVCEHACSEYLYTAINLIFIAAWRKFFPLKAEIAGAHFRKAGDTILTVLNNPNFKKNIEESQATDSTYQTMFYIGPPVGTGPAWTDIFDRTGAMLAEQHCFGESAHGPLVTVDSRVDEKFVRLEERQAMAAKFGVEQTALWEKKYLAGKNMDEFIDNPPGKKPGVEKTPFFAAGAWYLPELSPDYDTANDNLIIMDASWERYQDQALDEISVFGCRYPRMILITQQTFLNRKTKDALYRFPVSSMIILPEIESGPIPDMHLPLVMNMVGEEFAACAQM